jgi:hypothetical protein
MRRLAADMRQPVRGRRAVSACQPVRGRPASLRRLCSGSIVGCELRAITRRGRLHGQRQPIEP